MILYSKSVGENTLSLGRNSTSDVKENINNESNKKIK